MSSVSSSSTNQLSQEKPSHSHPFKPEAEPQLLVSVRNREEARLALGAGVKILDVKEPDHGSLGQATPSIIQEIGQEIGCDPTITFSVALGELNQYRPEQQFSKLPSRINFVKLGLAGCGADSSWRENYSQLRNQLTVQTGNSYGWVAVVYADYQAAHSPDPSTIIDYAIENTLSGVLIDTYEKKGRSLLDHFSLVEIMQFSDKCRENGLFLALAGSLKQEHLPKLIPLAPQILAVRGAACAQNNRRAQLDPEKIAELQALLTTTARP